MRRYETIFIVDPDISEEVRNQLFTKSKDLIAAMNGFLAEFDEWGARKLAYAIKKKTRGYYVRMDYCGDGALVAELERTFRLDEKYLKFMTILLADDADPEKVKAELEDKEKAAAEAAAATEEATAEAAKETEKEAAAEAAPETESKEKE